jgi:putative ATP-binding cassette transporter
LTRRGQQRLGFARLFLHRPNWILMQEASNAFDPAGEEKMMNTLQDEFPDATIIAIGFHPTLDRFFNRKICLERAADGHYLFGGPNNETNPEMLAD